MRRLLGVDFGDDFYRLAGRLHAVHAGRADADALLTATLAEAVEFRAVQQLAEDQRNLLFDNAGAVILDANLVAVVAGRLDMDPDFWQNAGLFTGVERVIDRLLD